MAEKVKAGIVGATGMVGQRFITLLNDCPWFETAGGGGEREIRGEALRRRRSRALGDAVVDT